MSELEQLAGKLKDRHYEKFAEREKTPKLFDTASPLCSSFHKGLQQCVYNQASWPTVWFNSQNQHCTALLNIVTQKLDNLESELLQSQGLKDPTSSFNSSSHAAVTDGVFITTAIDDWFDFGVGFGFGILGYLLLSLLKFLCRRSLTFLTEYCRPVPSRAHFSFVRSTPTRIPSNLTAVTDTRTVVPRTNRNLDLSTV